MNEGKQNVLMLACGGTALLAFLFLVYAAVYVDIKNADVATLLTGIITGSVGTMTSFYFGTSRSSEDKTRIISRMKPRDEP